MILIDWDDASNITPAQMMRSDLVIVFSPIVRIAGLSALHGPDCEGTVNKFTVFCDSHSLAQLLVKTR